MFLESVVRAHACPGRHQRKRPVGKGKAVGVASDHWRRRAQKGHTRGVARGPGGNCCWGGLPAGHRSSALGQRV